MNDTDPDMAHHDGKTCADCRHFERCERLISRKGEETECDWSPTRFQPAKENA